ncbi:unnamed protein product [Rhizophagus irregularis]|nr:unnamed protein product [Rhizophagus irregularis]
MGGNDNNTKQRKWCSGHFHFYLSIVYLVFELELFLADFIMLIIMSHEGVILFTFDSLLTFIIINTSARMAMTFGFYHIILLILVVNFSKISIYILTYYFVDKYFQTTFLDALTKRSSFLSISNIMFIVFSFDVIVSFITLCLYFYDIRDRHKENKIPIKPREEGKEKFEILIGIREKKKDKRGYILTTDKADKKLTCAVNYYKIILVCAHLNLWICGLLKIEWCLWWAFGIYHEDQWLLLYSIPWSLLLPVVNIFTMLKESRTASRQCLFIHYFFSILQIVYCIYEFFRYKKFELTFISRIILILLLVNYSPSEEYDPDHKYDFEEVYKNYEKEKWWI